MSNLDSFNESEEKRKKINNELVCQSYRDFCKQNDLKFHFWDELPANKFNAEISTKEMKLHHEAMNCFNNLKPRFVLFDNKIYSFHYTDWGGDFNYECWEIQEFLNQTYDEINESGVYEKQAKIAVDILTIVVAILIIILTVSLDIKFIKLPISWLSLVIGIGVAILVGYLIKKKLIHDPLKRVVSEKEKFVKRLSNLKKQFISTKEDMILKKEK